MRFATLHSGFHEWIPHFTLIPMIVFLSFVAHNGTVRPAAIDQDDQSSDLSSGIDAQQVQRTPTTVGMATRLDQIVLPGKRLIVRPMANRHDPFVLRIVASYPHGTDYRYDLECYALEAGTYDISQYLQLEQGGTPESLPKILVEVTATLESGSGIPIPLRSPEQPWLRGYRLALGAGGLLWLLGLYVLFTYGRRRPVAVSDAVEQHASIEDQLRPLVHAACEGTISASEKGELERTLIAYWCQRLRLHDRSPSQAMNELRNHPDAGPLLLGMERWLHCPNSQQPEELDDLLRPYGQVEFYAREHFQAEPNADHSLLESRPQGAAEDQSAPARTGGN